MGAEVKPHDLRIVMMTFAFLGAVLNTLAAARFFEGEQGEFRTAVGAWATALIVGIFALIHALEQDDSPSVWLVMAAGIAVIVLQAWKKVRAASIGQRSWPAIYGFSAGAMLLAGAVMTVVHVKAEEEEEQAGPRQGALERRACGCERSGGCSCTSSGYWC